MTLNERNGQRDALVIVAKYPAAGHVKTRLGATIGYEQSASLYRAFLCDLAERFSRAALVDGYDLIWACPDNPAPLRVLLRTSGRILRQRGQSFAERLYNICRDVATLGYARTIILGSDSPQIATATIARTFALLRDAEVALGPADDGGYYLIGLRNRPAPPDLFTGIEMSTSWVLRQTLERAASLGLSLRQLETTFDVDTEADLLRLAHALYAKPALAPRTRAVLETLLVKVEHRERGADDPR